MKALHIIAFALVIIGALNWGFMAFGYNAVESLLGSWPGAVTAVYTLVGLAAIYKLVTHGRHCKECKMTTA